MQPESFDPAMVEGFDEAQRRGWRLLADVANEVAVGLSEVDVVALAEDRLAAHGFEGWFHRPEVAIGDRIGRSPLRQRPSASVRVQAGDLIAIDLGPASGDFYADVGITLHVPPAGGQPGDGAPTVLEVARECTRGCAGFASQWKTVGEIFVFAQAWATNHSMDLASKRAIGHEILPKEGVMSLGFPRSAHLATHLRRHQIHFLHPRRIRGVWAVRPVLQDGAHAASFEEMFYIDGDVRRVLGRDSLDEVGTLPAL